MFNKFNSFRLFDVLGTINIYIPGEVVPDNAITDVYGNYFVDANGNYFTLDIVPDNAIVDQDGNYFVDHNTNYIVVNN